MLTITTDDFIIRALIGGVGVILASTPLGCFLLWRRMSYFSDSLSHSALLGIALSLAINLSPLIGAICTGILFAIVIASTKKYSNDYLLVTFASTSLALSLIISSISRNRVDLDSYLFGDILLITKTDIIVIFILATIVLIWLKIRWRPLLISTINEDLAIAEKINLVRLNIELMVIISLVVAISFQLVGILLISAILIIPASAARTFSSSPIQMIIIATFIGIISLIVGLLLSIKFNFASGAVIILSASGCFIIGHFINSFIRK